MTTRLDTKAVGASCPVRTSTEMKAAVYGAGAVGARAARQLFSCELIDDLVLIDRDGPKVQEAASSLGGSSRALVVESSGSQSRTATFEDTFASTDVVVLAAYDDHVDLARRALQQGCHVVSVSDDLDTVGALRNLDGLARDVDRSLAIGAGFAPGLACLLARHAASMLDVLAEIHIAKFGTGGPSCARQHHRALRSDGMEWREGKWHKRRGGSGRELCWFPDPVGGLDCYFAALPDPLLLTPAFSGLTRVTARVSATRRDMSTKWLPMLRRPHPEGLIGAVRVEARGWRGTVRDEVVLGVLDRPAVAAGTVAAVVAAAAHQGKLARTGAGGLAELVDDVTPLLAQLAKLGVKAAVFEGAAIHGG